MELNVLNIQGTETGRKISFADDVFGIEPNDHAIYLDVKQYLANQRQGTHKAKGRADIARTTKKLKRQKGTGGARAGSMKSPLFRGGGRAHGPQPRDYSFKLNKKLKQVARASALAYKLKNNEVTVVEDFDMETPKTKEFISILKNLNLAGTKTLMVLSDNKSNVYLSGRNVPKSSIMVANELNTYQILNTRNLVLSENSVKIIQDILSK
ncbi:MAG TPA: 50S ribosomal protein L4 [Bacteroidetes bacterium]|nr:50S ribosomal protein L4 [Bacteroidota bacterium]